MNTVNFRCGDFTVNFTIMQKALWALQRVRVLSTGVQCV